MNRLPKNIDILQNINLFSVENTLTHIKKSIRPVLNLFHLDEELKSLVDMQYKEQTIGLDG